jgi:uncharacterized membrane protein
MSKYCNNCGSKLIDKPKFCQNCGNNVNSEESELAKQNKRQKVIASKQKSFNSVNIILLVGLLGVIAIYFFTIESKENKIIKEQPIVVQEIDYPSSPTNMVNISSRVENGKIIIPLDEVKKGKFVSFSYRGKNGSVPLLAYLSEEGRVITAISMCEPCNSTTFHIKGNELVCNSCGTTWEVDNLEAISGSCGKYPPDPIPSVVVENEIQISEQNVTNWRRRI